MDAQRRREKTNNATIAALGIVGLVFALLLSSFEQPAWAQACPVNSLTLSGAVNDYWPGVGTINPATASLVLGTQRAGVDAVTGLTPPGKALAVGDLILIVQMQDTTINFSNNANYGANAGNYSGYLALNYSGQYHFARVVSVAGATIGFWPATPAGVTFRSVATVPASAGQKTFQIVRVPFARTITVNGTLKPLSWNGSTGGVVAIEAGQDVLFNVANGIDASALGFRGGGGNSGNGIGGSAGTLAATSYANTPPGNLVTEDVNGSKGEGIAGTPRLTDSRESTALLYGYTTADKGASAQGYPVFAASGSVADFGRGAPGNAGGGGTGHDAGGGGGANGGAGGKGGGRYNDGADYGGRGGAAVGQTSVMVMGGGGGAAQGFHTPSVGTILSGGGRGGGLVFVRGDTISGATVLSAAGQDGDGVESNGSPLDSTNLRGLAGDGGGAGGSIWLASASSALSTLTINAQGGKGGRTGHYSPNISGPGGGGGGGRVLYYSSGAAPTINLSGGDAGNQVSVNGVAPTPLPADAVPGSGSVGISASITPVVSPCAEADLAITKTSGQFTPGQTGATYKITVTNVGSGPKNAGATVTVSDTLPTGMAATAIGGANWSCALGSLTCTRSDKLNAGSAYEDILLTVNIGPALPGNTSGTAVNTATVAVSGQTETGTANNTVTATAYITAAYQSVRLASDADASGSAPTVGDTLTWSLFVANPANGASIADFQVADLLPAGVAVSAIGAQLLTDVNGTCGTLPTKNTLFDGANAVNLIAAGQTLPANCVLRIDIPTTIKSAGTLISQPVVTGTGLAGFLTDAIDNTTPANTLPTGIVAPGGSFAQTQTAARDPNGLTVLERPTLALSFNPPATPVGGTSTAIISMGNANANPITLTANFVDTLPAGLTVANAVNGGSCAGAVSAPVGGNTITYPAGASIPSGGCTIAVQVVNEAYTGAAIVNGSGLYANTVNNVAADKLSTNAGQPAPGVISGKLSVIGAYKSVRLFIDADGSGGGGATIGDTLEWSVFFSNPGGGADVSSFTATDLLGAGHAYVAGSLAATATGCAVPSLTAFDGAATPGLIAGPYVFVAGCNLKFTYRTIVTASSVINNQAVADWNGVGAASVSTDNIDASTTGLPPAVASLGANVLSQTQATSIGPTTVSIASRPTVAKMFSAPSLANGGTADLTIALGNGNPFAISLVAALTDNLPAGMTVHTYAPGGPGACGGVTAAAGASSVTVANNATIPAGGCAITVKVTSTTAGLAVNSIAIGALQTTAGSNIAAASAGINVLAAPQVAKSFSPSTISSGGTSTLTVTLGNPNAAAITIGSIMDVFPTSPGAGVTRAPVPVAGTNCTGGTVSSTSGSVTLTGGTIPANGICSFHIDVTAANAGSYLNTIAAGALSSSGGSNLMPAGATLMVNPVADVSVGKAGPAVVSPGAAMTYTVTVSNVGPDAAAGVFFSDAVPSAITGVGVQCTGNGGAVCGTIGIAANAVSSTITSLPAGASAVFAIQGVAPASGTLTNSATATVANGTIDPDDPGRIGAGNNTSKPVVTVVQAPDLVLAKTASAASFVVGGNAGFTLVPSNVGSLATSGPIVVTDVLPSGLGYVAAGSGGAGWNCASNAQEVTCTSSAVIAANASGTAITINVQVASNAVPGVTNVATIAGGGEPPALAGNNSATVAVPVIDAPGIGTFVTDGTQTGLPGASVLYTHTFNAGTAGTVVFSTSHAPSPNISGWTNLVYRDLNCNGVLDGIEGGSDIGGIAQMVAAGGMVCIVVKSNIPQTAAYGAQDVISVKAQFTGAAGAAGTFTRTDVTTVGLAGGAGLTLMKSVRNITQGGSAGIANSAKPGDVLEYVIGYANSSNAPLGMIVINDVTPPYSTFLSAACAMPLPSALVTCAISAPAVGVGGSLQWVLSGPLAASQSGAVLFRVAIQ